MMSRLRGILTQKVMYPMLLMPTHSQAARLARDIRNHQRWSLSRLQQYQLERLTSLVQIAGLQSPFYRERFAECGVSADSLQQLDDIRQFPITTKSDIEGNFPDRMVVQSRRNEDWQYVGTRGTTHRVMVVQDYQRRDGGRAAGLVALTEDSPYKYGAGEVTIPPDACSVHCGIESSRAPSVRSQVWQLVTGKLKWNRESVSDLRGLVMDHWIRRSTALPPLDLDAGDPPLRDCIETLRQHHPAQLVALPEYLRALAEYSLRTGDMPPVIPVVRPMGANMPAVWKKDVARAFRGSVREHYGSREMGSMAFDCRYQNGLHLQMDRHLIEIVRDGHPVQPGEIGSLLVTDLDNLSMPIIRYEIGDLARIEYEPCPCGRTTPRIFLEGRLEDAFVTEDGQVLTAEAVGNYFEAVPEVRDFQLTEDRRGKWTLRIAPAIAGRRSGRGGDRGCVSAMGGGTAKPESSCRLRHQAGIVRQVPPLQERVVSASMAGWNIRMNQGLASVRQQFPAAQRMHEGRPVIYLDSAATYLKPQPVIDACHALLYANGRNGRPWRAPVIGRSGGRV